MGPVAPPCRRQGGAIVAPRRARRFAAGAITAPVAALAVSAALLLAACGGTPDTPPPPPPGAIPAGEPLGTASIGGTARFEGTPPPRRPLRMTGESACHRPEAPALTEDVIVDPSGRLKNVVVRIAAGLGDRVFAPSAAEVVLDQQGCVFVPHVLAAMTDQIVLFRNSDPATHNVRAVATKNPTFNISMATRGRTFRRFFHAPEIITIRCDIHAWMRAYIAVSEHPFQSITGDDGSFTLTGLPAGRYDLEAWHETLGTARQTVTVGEGATGQAEFTFRPREAARTGS